MPNAPASESIDHLSELADPEPNDLVHEPGEFRIRLIFKSDRDEPRHAEAFGLLGKQQR